MDLNKELKYTLNSLMDFQTATVERVLESYREGKKRFLVADEVGLGKTIVAKGVIARLIQERTKNKPLKVIYICSNQSIAKQNIAKLNPFKRPIGGIDTNSVIHNSGSDRITLLARDDKKENESQNRSIQKLGISIEAITPGTSLDVTSTGNKDERILLYYILLGIGVFDKRATQLKWFLCTNGIDKNDWQSYLRSHKKQMKIRRGIEYKYKIELNKPLEDEWLIKRLEKDVHPRWQSEIKASGKSLYEILKIFIPRKGYHVEQFYNKKKVHKVRNALIGELRHRLAKVCIEYLDADLFILDEFQRFAEVIDTVTNEKLSPAQELAREVFKNKDAKILMLSATPFKSYSTNAENLRGESHYSEFQKVLKFLMMDKGAEFFEELARDNTLYFEGIRDIEKVSQQDPELINVHQIIQRTYREIISRMERSAVESADMRYTQNESLEIRAVDIRDFMVIDRIIQRLNSKHSTKLAIPIEYVKSTPYPLSFMNKYVHYDKLEEFYCIDPEIRQLVNKTESAFVNERNIKKYNPLIPNNSITSEPNPKLRELYKDIRENTWGMLWIPPSIPYYQVGRRLPYQNHPHKGNRISKKLIFSKWRMVPRMIATLASYEAERLAVKNFDQKNPEAKSVEKLRYGSDEKRFPASRWDVSDPKYFALVYPCVALAELIDPVQFLSQNLTQTQVLKITEETVRKFLIKSGVRNLGVKNGVNHWNWYAPIWLDKNLPVSQKPRWLKSYNAKEYSDHHNTISTTQFIQFQKYYRQEGVPKDIKKLTDKEFTTLVRYLAKMSLSAPGVVALRSLRTLYSEVTEDLLAPAHKIALGLKSLYSKSESVAIVLAHFSSKGYYNNVLEYGLNGNIQSMLDEYLYQLYDTSDIKDPFLLADHVQSVLSITASNLEINTISTLKSKYLQRRKSDDDKSKNPKSLSIRTHYAQHFGIKNSNSKHDDNIRSAFNSPFRPFILCSTSIGQEGLDFHQYCEELVHWNLPHNPIDLEQREGRIKRYKGFNIRGRMCDDIEPLTLKLSEVKNLWDQLYQQAQEATEGPCDLIPFWCYSSEDNRPPIRTITPYYPYSREEHRLAHIKNVLTNYRLTFGQPRQEDLIAILSEHSSDQVYRKNLQSFLLNLSPLDTRP